MDGNQNLYAVIMAGGKGTRFWPLSREERPKQFLAVVGDEPMIRVTVDRILPLIPADQMYVVAGKDHLSEIQEILPDLNPENLIGEPEGKNTAACIGLAAEIIQKRDPDGVMVILPADHTISKTAQFRDIISAGATLAFEHEYLVTLGITPNFPETGFGYIETHSESISLGKAKALKAANFHEKPTKKQAEDYIARGNFYFNSGMFIWRARTILAWMKKLLPETAEGLKKIAQAMGDDDFENTMAEVYSDLEAISIDYGVLEKADDIWVLPADIGWSDVGSWSQAAKHWPDTDGNTVQGECLFIDSNGCVVHCPHKMVALIGIQDLIVVDTPDALLICAKGRDQDVKKAVEELKLINRHDLL